MSEHNEPIPAELDAWMEARLAEIASLLTKARRIRTGQRNDQEQWLSGLLREISETERTANIVTNLLTAYAVRKGHLNATTVGKLTKVTISTAQARSGSRTAESAWSEIWPAQSEKHASGGDLQQR